jgi:hypothetical protein
MIIQALFFQPFPEFGASQQAAASLSDGQKVNSTQNLV